MGFSHLLRSTVFTVAFIILFSSCAVYSRLEQKAEAYSNAESYFSDSGLTAFPSSFPNFYYDGPSWTERALELIASAERYILIDTFLIGDHPNSFRIFSALKEASDRGVTVRLMIDSASYYRNDRLTGEAVHVPVHELREMGLAVVEYNPIRAWRIYRLLHLLDRDHRKFWIIDGETVTAGVMNIDRDSLNDPEESRGSIDGMTEIYSPEAARMLTEVFITSWNHYALDPLDLSDFPLQETDESRIKTHVWVIDQGKRTGSTVTTMFDGFFIQAQEELWLMQAYLVLTPPLLERIRFAVDRGAAVHIILSDNHVADRFEKATYYNILDLIRAGARVYIYRSPTGSLLHKKMLLADDRLVSVGSANYNFRSQYLSREISFVFDDPFIAADIREFLDEILEHSCEVDLEEAGKYRGMGCFLNFLLMQPGG